MRPLVENADTLLKWSKRVFGKTIVNGIVKHTFFHQFCAGKALHTLPSPTTRTLQLSRIFKDAFIGAVAVCA